MAKVKQTVKQKTKVNLEDLNIRPLEERDVKAIHAYGSDPEVTRFLTFGPNTWDDTISFVERVITGWNTDPLTNREYVIELCGEVIGGCGVHSAPYDSAEIGYILRKDMWGRGIATEAAAFLIDTAFSEMNVHRVIAYCEVENVGSYRVMENNGMRREGLLRSFLKKGDVYYDAYLYAILESEYCKLC